MKNAMVTCEYGCCEGSRVCLGDDKGGNVKIITARSKMHRGERNTIRGFRQAARKAKESHLDYDL